ncbi:TPA: magnesium transporter CorA family protein [Streptococcus pyogenes]|uniref:magnesium transporter CorA family protein n=1 Tax=Streptococcus pyogenes TaxID=1314 RepID=UPI000DA3AD0B|nr:magnesium transporter CorA family protein [Streptococcus pyogenes]SQF09433.1 magnesium and cobalt transport protein [Streptococcus pyogenes]VGU21157.1 magnesium and cobalt transport protein [Streptococcus pyogenes]HEQ0433089.1 magnesium transporter CorA family protein [Streptococcus pyogenes]HEQ0441461.1 magnesium transporter CorA family protein [Streptococcus pyogenes]HEQ0467473.1 magnesium transporter CorA family protein [Streptococcus pyogenes]
MPTLPKASSAITLINLDQLTEHDQEALVSEGLIDAEVFDYAKDKNETSFMEENKEKLTIVFQILDRQEEAYHPNHIPLVIPITLFLNDQSLYILGYDHSLALIEEVFSGLDESRSPRHLVFQLLTAFTKQYVPLMDEIAQQRDKLIEALRQKANKTNLESLANLQSGTVYILMGSKQNEQMLAELKDMPGQQDLEEDEAEQLRDAIIEARQLSNMCDLNTRVLKEISSSYNNVLSNNLNNNVTSLTIFSIGISIIAMVTSFYGMNVKLPFAKIDSVWFWIVLTTSLVALLIMVVMYWYVHKRNRNASKRI